MMADLETVLKDETAISLARAVAVANSRARAEGVELDQTLLSAAEEISEPERCWRISYSPRDYTNFRGGDLIIDVAMDGGTVRRVLHGQ